MSSVGYRSRPEGIHSLRTPSLAITLPRLSNDPPDVAHNGRIWLAHFCDRRAPPAVWRRHPKTSRWAAAQSREWRTGRPHSPGERICIRVSRLGSL
jgi:hypothetical protein